MSRAEWVGFGALASAILCVIVVAHWPATAPAVGDRVVPDVVIAPLSESGEAGAAPIHAEEPSSAPELANSGSEIAREPWSHDVVVRDLDGNPVAGAFVEVWESTTRPTDGALAIVKTGVDGRAQLSIPATARVIRAFKQGIGSSGYQEAWRGMLTLIPQSLIHGTVLDAEGSALEDAVVLAQPSGYWREGFPDPVTPDPVRTNVLGRFALSVSRTFDGYVSAESGGFRAPPAHVSLVRLLPTASTDDDEIVLRLAQKYKLRGRIHGPPPAALESARLEVRPGSPHIGSLYEPPLVQVRSNGSYEVLLPWPGLYEVETFLEGWPQRRIVHARLSDEKPVRNASVELLEGRTLDGWVRTAGGTAVLNARVSARRTRGDDAPQAFQLAGWKPNSGVRTGPFGHFKLEGLVEGLAYELAVSDYSPSAGKLHHDAGVHSAGDPTVLIVVENWATDDELHARHVPPPSRPR